MGYLFIHLVEYEIYDSSGYFIIKTTGEML